MKTTAVVDQNGVVINLGPWVYVLEDGSENPFPEGAVEGEFDITQTADGRYVLETDYKTLRAAEYPSIGDQLDALYRAGVFPPEIAERISEVKAKYQKP